MELTHIIVVYYDYEIVFGLKLVGNRAVYIYVPSNTRLKTLNPCAAGAVYIRFRASFRAKK